MPVDLLPEIWLQVIKLLRNPLPRPTGKNARSSIRQRDLCALMRVNRLFHNLTGPLLYSTIVVDSLPLLVHRYLPSAARGVRSKQELLGFMERLYIEYGPKHTPSYETLLRFGGRHFSLIELNPAELARVCSTECDEIAFGASKLFGISNRMLSISTGAFLGGQKDVWSVVCQGDPPGVNFPSRATPARMAISKLVANPYLVYFCNRVEFGPLTWISFSLPDDRLVPRTPAGPKTLQHHAHMELDSGTLPVLVGGKSRWYCPFDRPENFQGLTDATEKLAEIISSHMSDREVGLDQTQSDVSSLTNPSLNVDIYLPPQMMHPKARNHIITEMDGLRELVAEKLEIPKSRWEKDVFKLHNIRDAPVCQACQWHPDDMDY